MGHTDGRSLRGVFSLLLALIVIGVLIGAGIWWKRSGGVKVEVGFDKAIDLTPQQIRKIEEIGEWEFLAVQQEVVTDTVRKGIFTDDRLVSIYTGTLRFGVDLRLTAPDWITSRSDTVFLKLPKIRLLDRRFIDEARTRVFYESGKWSNKARQQQYYKAYNQMLRNSMTPENMKQAESYAREAFRSLFESMGFKAVIISFP